MRKLLLLAFAAGLLTYALAPQWRSYERMGDRRLRALNKGAKEVLVGVCWPFSTNQDGMADGIRLAQEEINARGLAGGLPFRLAMRDDDFDWEKGKRIAVEFAETPQMSAVVGYYDDSLAIKASAIHESARMLHLIVGANATSMTSRGFEYMVRTAVPGDRIGRLLARMSVHRGRRRPALLWEQNAYGEDLAYQYKVELDAMNVDVVYQWTYAREHADFRQVVNELKAVDTDVIFFAGIEPWAGDFLREARRVGIQTEIVGAFTDTPEMRARAGRALEGALFYDTYDVNSSAPANQEFVRKFHARYGRAPDEWAAQGYDALHILARAVRATGSCNPQDLAYAVRYMEAWEGANGRYKFDNRGELEDKPIYLNQIRNGSPVKILTSGSLPVLPTP